MTPRMVLLPCCLLQLCEGQGQPPGTGRQRVVQPVLCHSCAPYSNKQASRQSDPFYFIRLGEIAVLWLYKLSLKCFAFGTVSFFHCFLVPSAQCSTISPCKHQINFPVLLKLRWIMLYPLLLIYFLMSMLHYFSFEVFDRGPSHKPKCPWVICYLAVSLQM